MKKQVITVVLELDDTIKVNKAYLEKRLATDKSLKVIHFSKVNAKDVRSSGFC